MPLVMIKNGWGILRFLAEKGPRSFSLTADAIKEATPTFV
jgi:hypothetical protein